MRLRFCDVVEANCYRAMIEADDGQTETLFARTIPGLREMVLSRIEPNASQIVRVDELFERLLDDEISFTKQWLHMMNARISRAAA